MIVIREARPEDARGIAAVHVSSWQEAYRGLLPADVLAGLSVTGREQVWTAILSDPSARDPVLVAADGTTVLGFVSMGPDRGGAASEDTGELYAFYVHPGCWREGIGGRLHSAAIQRLTALRFVSAALWVLAGNDRALGFYRSAGWVPDGQTKTDSGPGGIDLHELRLYRRLRAR
ncbi:N-acetyltransferase family protein [Pseudonocardia xinjiangensis]|uniref:GNAT family N-acetyltransferase n=1 Tax=Pseudonocardia xinjiangensis TaxID=75289 RepID=UPI003D937FF2